MNTTETKISKILFVGIITSSCRLSYVLEVAEAQIGYIPIFK